MIARLLCGFGRFVWGVAKVCIVLTMLAGFSLAVYFLRPVPVPAPQEGSLLELTLTGRVADTRPVAGGLAGMIREADPVTLLGDVTDAVRYAQKDSRIAGILLNVSDLESIGGASARVIGEILDEYRRETGRHVWCYGWNFTQAQYAVAAHADRLWLHPMGRVDLRGLSGEALYWGSFLKHFGIKAEVYKAGDFKSAPEVFERSSPTKENLAAQRSYLSDAWSTMLDAWKAGRGWKDDAWETYAEALSALEPMPEGEASHQRRYGIVDETGDEAAFRAALRTAYAKAGREVALTNFYDYLDSSDSGEGTGPGVAVLYAEGEMVDDPRLGRLVADELVERIDFVKENENVRAVVLRINSPGGDAMAAEKIRSALLELKEKGKPVVVSMGDTAASGGYWVSTGAEKIVADPMTLTGSIGVFAVFPKLVDLREALSVGYGGYATEAALSDGEPWRDTSAVRRHALKSSVDFVYRTFKSHVAEARALPLPDVERLAAGRVWTGRQALDLGLVDELGTLETAVTLAKKVAKLPSQSAVYHFDVRAVRWWQPILSGFPAAQTLFSKWNEAEEVFGREMGRVQAFTPLPSSL